MSSRHKPIIAAVVVAIVAVALFVVLKPSDSSDEPSADSVGSTTAAKQNTTEAGQASGQTPAEVPTVVFKNGAPVGGILGIEVKKGDTIKFRVKSDIADEVHVHGFDLGKDVPAGGSVSFSFPADITGIYEAEMENLGVQIAELQIDP